MTPTRADRERAIVALYPETTQKGRTSASVMITPPDNPDGESEL